MPSGYIIANVRVTNPAQYEEYKKWSTAAFQAHNAEICVRGGAVEVMEGDWTPERVVIAKFPSFEAAKAFYHSPEYGKARAARIRQGPCRPNTARPVPPAKARPSCAWSASKAFDALILIAYGAFCISASTRFDLKLL